MKYRILGIDLDGTLLDGNGRLSAANLAALRRAQDAGVRVVPCTGRAWRESFRALAEAAHLETGVFVTGAMVTDMPTGKALDRATIEPTLAMRIVRLLIDAPEAVLVFRDADETGHDYLVTGSGKLTGNTSWWFEHTGATVHFQTRIDEADLHHTLRVGMVADDERMRDVMPRLHDTFGDRIAVHAFEAMTLPATGIDMHVLEIFGQGVDKWRGLKWIAQQHGIDAGDIAVIGDEVNDLPMFAASSCGIAMGNAIEPVRHAARYITLTNEENGVAHAIDMLLTGKWG